MGLECERWEWRELFASEHGPNDPSTRLVLFALFMRMNQAGAQCFPSQATIAAYTGLSERSVRTHLGLAEKAGWLKIYRKRRTGQAWFVNEYVAVIPDDLIDLVKPKPWEEDPDFERAANSAGRSTTVDKSVDKLPANGEHPANGAQHPANDSGTPGNPCTTGGNLRHDTRKGLPTILDLNSSSNSSNNSSVQRAVASDHTAGLIEQSNEKQTKDRTADILKLIEAMPQSSDHEIAKVARVGVEAIQQARGRHAPS